jgi:hypothetical protein
MSGSHIHLKLTRQLVWSNKVDQAIGQNYQVSNVAIDADLGLVSTVFNGMLQRWINGR